MDSVNENNMTSVEYSDNVVEEALINTLFNNDILAEILSYLSPIQLLETPLVCKKWREASFFAWKNIKVFYWERCLYEENCLKLILSNCGYYLKYMTIKPFHIFESYLTRYCSDNYDHDTVITIICQYCPNLTHLSICNIRCWSSSVMNSFIKLGNLKFLKFEDIRMYSISTDLYESILKIIPKDIEEIHFMIVPYRSLSLTVINASIVTLLAEFNNLRCLSLEGWKLDNNFIEMITRKNKRLSYLSLHRSIIENKNLLSGLMCRISNACKVLKFSLSDPHGELFDHNFQFENKFKLLECLEITDPNDNVIISISDYCQNIKSLSISSNTSEISGYALKKLEKLKNLESLNLNIYIIDDDGFLSHISKHCKKIKQLTISLPWRDDDDVQWSKELSLKKISEMENLENLSVNNVWDIDDDFIECIVKGCKKLEYFSIDDCSEMTDNSVQTFIKIEKLKKFDTTWFCLNDFMTVEIISKMTNLSDFNCTSNIITDECIIQVIKNCLYLKNLRIYGEENMITVKSLIYAAKKTRKRQNYIILTIHCEYISLYYKFLECDFYKTDSNKSLHKSPYLNITQYYRY